MSHIKKFVFLFILAAFVFALAGCGGSSSGPKCAPNCTYEDMVVGFLQTGSEGGWRAANRNGMRSQLPIF